MTNLPRCSEAKAGRYYYDDPLEAAWMAKHHGMRFLDVRGAELLWGVVDNVFCWAVDDVQPDGSRPGYAGIEFYPCHDSLPLLEPRVGDAGIVRYDEFEELGQWPEAGQISGFQSFEILQRDGRAFFTPKCVED